MGGALDMGANNITMTGSLGVTGSRLLKGWFTDLEVTNPIAGSVTGSAGSATGNAGTVTNGVYTTAANNLTGNNTFTSATASPILIKPAGAPAADAKLFDMQATGAGVTNFSVDAEGDVVAHSFTGNLTGNVTGNVSGTAGSVTGNAGTATALAADPTDCALPNVALGVNASGVAQCGQPSDVTGSAATATSAATVTNAAQTAITSVGTLTGLTMGGALDMGANNITMTGSLGVTGSRLLKGWFTDLEVTNPIAGSVTGSAGTVTNGVYTTAANNLTGNNTFTSATASPILIKPAGAPAADAKLFDMQATGAGVTNFSVDAEGDVVAHNLGASGDVVITGGLAIGTVSPDALFHVHKTASAGAAETLAEFTVSDGLNSALKIVNASATDAQFIPSIAVNQNGGTGDLFKLYTTANNDAAFYGPMVAFDSGSSGAVLRDLFHIRNYGTTKFQVSANGSLTVGIAGETNTINIPGYAGSYQVAGYPALSWASPGIQVGGPTSNVAISALGASGIPDNTAVPITTILNAGMNSQILTAVKISPTFNPGIYTGLQYNGLIVEDGNVIVENGSVGIGNTSPDQKLVVNGAVRLGDTAINSAGSIRYNTSAGNHFQGYNGASWTNFDVSGGGWTNSVGAIYTATLGDIIGVGIVPTTGHKLEVSASGGTLNQHGIYSYIYPSAGLATTNYGITGSKSAIAGLANSNGAVTKVFGVAGYLYGAGQTDSAGVFGGADRGAAGNPVTWGALGYRDAGAREWAGYFNGRLYASSTATASGEDTIYAYQGTSGGGSSLGLTGARTAIVGHANAPAGAFSNIIGVAGYLNSAGPKESAGVLGAVDASASGPWGALGYLDGSALSWAGYFNGDVNLERNYSRTRLSISAAGDDATYSPSIVTKMKNNIGVIPANSPLFTLDSYGYNSLSSTYQSAAKISVVADAATGDITADMPGRIEFATTPDGTDVSQTRMVIRNNGNVGIGTTAPVTNVDLVGTSIPAFTGTTRGILSLSAPYVLNNYTAIDFLNTIGSLPSARIAAYSEASSSRLMFGTSNNIGTGITNTAMTIDSNGNIGIGTVDPTAKFHVAGRNSSSPLPIVLQADNNISAGSGGYINLIAGAANSGVGGQVSITAGATAAGTGQGGSVMIQAGVGGGSSGGEGGNIILMPGNGYSAGGVGIGTAYPNAKLDLQQSISDAYAVKISSNNGTGMMVITNNGRVGIGTITPAYKLHVAGPGGTIAGLSTSANSTDAAVYGWANFGADAVKGVASGGGFAGRFEGNVYITDGGGPSSGSKLEVKGDTSDSTKSALNVTNFSGYTLLFVRNDGRVGIGTTEPTAKLHVYGSTVSSPQPIILQADNNGASGVGGFINLEAGTTNSAGTKGGQVAIIAGNNINTTATAPGGDVIIKGGNSGSATGQGGNVLLMPGTNGGTVGGNVGIGTINPQATLHVNGYMRLSRYGSPPVTCDSAHDGVIALGSASKKLCICDGPAATWKLPDGATSCTW
ncbi:MAG: hypothetical protein A2270_01250 [Elusimicrobia bacterium RIFOXYA12_FULL_51_18]|nr:MAG: hypothetical protein A2270_01250 [Elusimicrobia bacterium RIFOXYA12_FULL_51_18]